MSEPLTLEKIVSFAKRRGFVFPSSEIYGGFAAVYDFGPYGVELANNIRQAWWKAMVRDGSLPSPPTWVNSYLVPGHYVVPNFPAN